MNLRLFMNSLSRAHELRLLRKCAVLILYSHFEGFTKQAAELYLELVLRQRLPYERLTGNFLALSVRGALREAAESDQIRLHMRIVEFFTYNQRNRATFDVGSCINTQSNVNARVFTNILETIGIVPDAYFNGRMLLLDGSLLGNRNAIAHGEDREIDEPTYHQLHHLVLEMMDHLRDCLENAAVLRAYVRQ